MKNRFRIFVFSLLLVPAFALGASLHNGAPGFVDPSGAEAPGLSEEGSSHNSGDFIDPTATAPGFIESVSELPPAAAEKLVKDLSSKDQTTRDLARSYLFNVLYRNSKVNR